MQMLDIQRPDMPDLQFVLLVTALSTSRLTALNISNDLRTTIFDRCWVLINDSPPPGRPEDRVLDLRPWTEVTVEAMAETTPWRGIIRPARPHAAARRKRRSSSTALSSCIRTPPTPMSQETERCRKKRKQESAGMREESRCSNSSGRWPS